MNKGFAIAIDGPVASGKGTLADSLARKIGGFSLNTGAMYRAVALYCFGNKINFNDEEAVVRSLSNVDLRLESGSILLNGEDVTERLKEPDISKISAIVASYKRVREDLVERQKDIALKKIRANQIVILEGRDIGTKVLPDADLKIFLTAKDEIRAQRRLEQYKEKGMTKTFEEVLEETRKRDELDSTREVDPLPSEPEKLGYLVLDDTNQNEEETLSAVINELKIRGLLNDRY